ncbi:MAG TPA: MAPEG family protein [Sphingomicrobium sp.]|nr:MAPEG family protein [Sphingomicrobium sp.]
MPYSPILVPVVALVSWTLVMLVWMAIARRRAFAAMGIGWGTIPRGARGVNLDGKAPDEAQWPSHNYNHLMEQPTIFYAIALTLAMMGMGGGLNYWLAWAYVGLRVVHSIVQSTVNIVSIRFTIFALASLCLVGLTVHAAARVLHDCGILRF